MSWPINKLKWYKKILYWLYEADMDPVPDFEHIYIKAVGGLNDVAHLATAMYIFGNYNYGQIAQEMKRSIGTVEELILHTREYFKREYGNAFILGNNTDLSSGKQGLYNEIRRLPIEKRFDITVFELKKMELLSATVASSLEEAKIYTFRDILRLNDEELTNIHGIGVKAIYEIKELLIKIDLLGANILV